MTKKVLFLCTGNSARSQMAEGFLRARGGERFEVHSAGLNPRPVNPLTVQVMDEVGIDIRAQYSKPLNDYIAKVFFHYYITVCADAEKQCPQALWTAGGVKLHWPFDDPAAVEGTADQKLAKFREVRDQIEARIQLWLTPI
jgi:arsenate reductase